MYHSVFRRLGLSAVMLAAFSVGVSAQSVDHTHSPAVAGIVEWLLPTAGYAYAGDWSAGLVSNAVRVGGMVLLLSTFDEPADTCENACAVGAVALLGGTIWAIVGAVNTARDHNRRVGQAVSRIDVGAGPEGSTSFGLRFMH